MQSANETFVRTFHEGAPHAEPRILPAKSAKSVQSEVRSDAPLRSSIMKRSCERFMKFQFAQPEYAHLTSGARVRSVAAVRLGTGVTRRSVSLV
jgi:hypothetical protein